MQRGALYIRVSTEDQTEFSPEAQKKLLLDYAKKNSIFVDSDHIFMDEGFSGRKAEKRPAFMRMIAVAKAKPKPFDVILVHKFDRFARNREDSVVYKSLLKKECDVRVVSITEQLEDDKFSIILESMLEAMAEYYSLNLSEEVTKGMTEKASRGELQSKAPLGYLVENNQYTIKEDEAEVVRYIFNEFVNRPDHSKFKLAKDMNALGYKTKQGTSFSTRSLEYILQNPAYIGNIAWTPNVKKELNFNHPDTIVRKGRHEAIINDDVFIAVQEIIRSQKLRRKPKQRPTTEYAHWLSGMLRCGTCGGPMYHSNNGTKKPMLQCRDYTKGKCTVSHYIVVEKLEQAILADIKTTFTENNVYRSTPRPSDSLNEKLQLENRIQKIDSKLERAMDAYVSGIDTIDEYKKNKALILKEKSALEKNLADHTTNVLDEKAFKDQLRSLYDALINSNISTPEKSNLMRTSIEKIVYCKEDNKLEVFYYV